MCVVFLKHSSPKIDRKAISLPKTGHLENDLMMTEDEDILPQTSRSDAMVMDTINFNTETYLCEGDKAERPTEALVIVKKSEYYLST